MKTQLPNNISSIEEAKAYLNELNSNDEEYHPEDDAHDIRWEGLDEAEKPTPEECDKLNKLMEDIYALKGFDPCEFLIELNPQYFR